MANQLDIRTRTQKIDNALTLDNNLANMMEKEGQWNKAVFSLYRNKYQLLDILSSYIKNIGDGGGNYTLMPNDMFYWAIQEQPNHLVKILQAPSNNGANGQPFQVIFEGTLLRPGYVIQWPSGTMSIIKGEGTEAANGQGGYLYTLQNMKKNATLSPTYDMVPGRQVSFFTSAYSELSITGYSHGFLSQLWKQHMTMCRLSYGISDVADTQATVFEYRNTNDPGKTWQKGLWWYKKQGEAMDLWYWMTQMMLVEGQSSVDDFNNSTHLVDTFNAEVKTGSGLLEFLRYAQNFQYYPGTTTYDWWYNLCYNLISVSAADGNKEFIFVAGPELYKEFNQAMINHVLSQRLSTNSQFLNKQNGKYSLGYEFDTFEGLFGCKLKIVPYWPWAAQWQYGHRVHPFLGKPLKSYEGVMIDVSPLAGGEKNIEILAKGDAGKNLANLHWCVPSAAGPRDRKDAGFYRPDGGLISKFHFLSQKAFVMRYPYSSAFISPAIS